MLATQQRSCLLGQGSHLPCCAPEDSANPRGPSGKRCFSWAAQKSSPVARRPLCCSSCPASCVCWCRAVFLSRWLLPPVNGFACCLPFDGKEMLYFVTSFHALVLQYRAPCAAQSQGFGWASLDRTSKTGEDWREWRINLVLEVLEVDTYTRHVEGQSESHYFTVKLEVASFSWKQELGQTVDQTVQETCKPTNHSWPCYTKAV